MSTDTTVTDPVTTDVNPTVDETTTQPGADNSTESTLTLEQSLKELERARKDAKKYRQQLRALENKSQVQQGTAVDPLSQTNERMSKYEKRLTHLEINRIANEKAVNPVVLEALINYKDINILDEGAMEDIDDLIKANNLSRVPSKDFGVSSSGGVTANVTGKPKSLDELLMRQAERLKNG